ncbi:MAG: 3D domain-containing protein [Acidobacteria bacterium]|nr:3D domain-containing protein [Acidobacteriota bacterium]
MILTNSLKRKIAATVGAAVGFAWLYQVTIFDSQYAARQAALQETAATPAPGARLRFTATAYCKGTTTASGISARTGIAAADPDLLPVGSVVQISGVGNAYNGVYTIMDSGPAVRGRELDLYMWNCKEAVEFGSRRVLITVLRLGWNPRASTPETVDRMFRQREKAVPSRAITIDGAAPAASQTTPEK